MYTTIPHAALFLAIRVCLDEVWQYMATEMNKDVNNIGLRWERCGANDCKVKWVSVGRTTTGKNTAKVRVYTLKALEDAVKFLVSNTYLVNGSTIRRQIIGIPMGTNCAPVVANLFLYAHESRFIDRLMATNRLETARAFHLTSGL
jgi:hypothetical protein